MNRYKPVQFNGIGLWFALWFIHKPWAELQQCGSCLSLLCILFCMFCIWPCAFVLPLDQANRTSCGLLAITSSFKICSHVENCLCTVATHAVVLSHLCYPTHCYHCTHPVFHMATVSEWWDYKQLTHSFCTTKHYWWYVKSHFTITGLWTVDGWLPWGMQCISVLLKQAHSLPLKSSGT